MKRIYVLFLFLMILFVAQSQPLLTEDFEDTAFPSAGWTLINGNANTGYTWTRNTDTTLAYVKNYQKPYPAFLGLGSMVYEADVTAAKAWAISRSLSLTNGISYTLTFYYAVFNSRNPEKLKVTVGNAPTIEAQTTVLWNNNGDTALANDSTWTKATIDYTPGASGNYYFGFNCYSDANEYALLIDNIKVEVMQMTAPPCAALTAPANGAAAITAPQALFTWDSVSAAAAYTFKLGTTQTPDSMTFSMGTEAYQSNLAYNTTYYWTVVPKNTAGSAEGCPVYSFTTQPAPPPAVNDDCTGAIELFAGSSITASTRSATQSIPAISCNGPAGNANDDVWFKYTASESGDAIIILTPNLIFDGVIDAYSGTCSSLTSLSCADQGYDGETETLSLSNLTPGKTYYFRVYGYGNEGKDGSFTLTMSGATLPVNIVNFKGEQNGVRNILSWTTLNEQNSKGFEVQRSANGRDFSTLQSIHSKAINGNSSSAFDYKFLDGKPISGANYYRLKQVDKDGKYLISDIILLKGLQVPTFALSDIYPNPSKSYINIVVTAFVKKSVDIIISDLAGKLVMHTSAQLTVGKNIFSLNINKLPSGSYIVKTVFDNGTESAVSKLIK